MSRSMDDSTGRILSAMFQAGRESRDAPQLYVGTVLNGDEQTLKIRCNGQELTREEEGK